MLFHVELMTRENIGLADVLAARKIVTDQVDVIMKSGKVKDSGVYADGVRGGFYIIEIDTPEELWSLFAPISDVSIVKAHPILPLELLPKLFQELAK